MRGRQRSVPNVDLSAGFVFDSLPFDLVTGQMSLASDGKYRVMLVTSAYKPSKERHARRQDVAGEVRGVSYDEGGKSVSVSVSRQGGGIVITLGAASWPNSTITARGAVYYRDTGDARDDNLIAFVDFGIDSGSKAGNFDLGASQIVLQN